MKDLIEIDVFKKLNQLDRIEYMLGIKRIEEKYETGQAASMINVICYCGLFSVLFLMLIYSTFGVDLMIKVTESLIVVFKILFFFLTIAIIFDFVMLFKRITLKSKLNKEFFKIEVKKK